MGPTPFFDDPLNRLWAMDLFALGLSQIEAADRMGITSRTIIRWLNQDKAAHRQFEQTRARVSRQVVHGTVNAYQHWACRCPDCKRANTEAHFRWKSRVWGTEPPAHGLSGYGNYGCRCEVCFAAQSAANRKQRERRKRLAKAKR